MKNRTVVIDPPWKLSPCNPKNSRHGGSAFRLNSIPKQLPYSTMTDKEIENFNIDDFAAAECNLFLWTTNSKLPVAFRIMEKWGFHYANLLVWNKLDGLNHNGVHATLEFVLYGYRGKNGLDYTKPLEAYFQAKRIKHSQKPDKFYSMIAKVTEPPRIDIFARKQHYGFEAWGNQVETQMEVPLFILSELPSRKEK
jgi:N6-adenosine-specific RNA methylase IME4